MLRVVYSDHDLDEAAGHTGVAGNAPEERKRLVQQALRSSNTLLQTSFKKVIEKEANIFDLGALVHSRAMLNFLTKAWEDWTEEWKNSAGNREHLLGVFCAANANAEADAEPPLFHAGFFAPRHESQCRDPPGCEAGGASCFSQACYFAMDKETPISSTTLVGLEWDLAVTRQAVRELTHYPVVYSQITHPGHHSFPSSYGGFCFLNQAAIAVKLMQQDGHYKRVAIVDVDFHCGNGTSAIFQNDANVFFASLHADPNRDYPFCFNAPKNSPTGGQQLHLVLPRNGCEWKQYKVLLEQVVQRVYEFNADALVVSLGVDTLRGDPVALPGTRCSLDPADYAEMGKMLLCDARLVHLPVLVVQEGGYKLDQVHLAVSQFLSAAAFKQATRSKM